MSYDRAELEQVIRSGGPLPEELLNIFKQDAARRRSAKIDARLRKATQHLKDFPKTGKSSPIPLDQQRFRRSQPGIPLGKPDPAPQPLPLACSPGWTTVYDSSAPFSWGSQETPSAGMAPDGTPQWSVMTRRESGEFSFVLDVDSNPTSDWSPTTNEGGQWKGVTLSATIGELYLMGQSPLVLQAYARIAMDGRLLDSVRVYAGDAYALMKGSATLTISQYALEFTGSWGHFPSEQTKLLGQASAEADLFEWFAGPDGQVFEDQINFDGSPFDLSVPLANHNDAVFTEIDVDIYLFAEVTASAPNSENPSGFMINFCAGDDPLIEMEQCDPTSYEGPPCPCPILLKELRLCSYP